MRTLRRDWDYYVVGLLWGMVTSVVISRGSLWFWQDWRWWTISVAGCFLYTAGKVISRG